MPGNDQYDDDFDFEDNQNPPNTSKQHANNLKQSPKLLDNSKNKPTDFDFNEEVNESPPHGQNKNKKKIDEYDDDFDDIRDSSSFVQNKSAQKSKKNNKSKSLLNKNFSTNKIKGYNDPSQSHKKQSQQFYSVKNPPSSFKTLNLKSNKSKSKKRYNKQASQKNIPQTQRISKTAQSSRNNHKYTAQVNQKLNSMKVEDATIETVHKYNQSLRDMIKKYNQYLSYIITKNISIFAKNQQLFKNKSFSSKKAAIQETTKVIKEEIRNNQQIQQMTIKQLKKVRNKKYRIQMRESEKAQYSDQQKDTLNNKIKEKKKQIYHLRLKIQNEAKKLIPQDIPMPIPKISLTTKHHSQMAKVKQQLLIIRRQHEKNQEKLYGLQTMEEDLKNKLEGIVEKDRQANQYINSMKQTTQKKKKYAETFKKFQGLRNYKQKVLILWDTKANVAAHENHSQKQKVKNMELQIKNIQESINQLYEKSRNMVQNPKLNSQNKKILEKLVEEMKVYEEHSTNKLKRQMTKSKLGKLEARKNSVSKFATDEKNQNQLKSINEPNNRQKGSQQDGQTQKQETRSEKNIIGLQNLKNIDTTKLQEEKQKSERVWKQQVVQKQQNIKQKSQQKIEQQQQKKNEIRNLQQKQDKKPFSLKKDKRQESLHQKSEQAIQPKIMKEQTKQQQTQNNQQIKDEQKKFIPKRFMKNIKKKNQDDNYLPTANEKKQNAIADNKEQKQSKFSHQDQQPSSKPMLRVRRKTKETQELAKQNQFMN